MLVVVHVEVVGIPVVAQRLFPLVQCSRPLRFTSCIPLIRCSTSLLRRSSYSRVPGRQKLVEIPQLHSYSCLDQVVHTPVVCNDRCPVVQTLYNCACPAVAVR